MEGLLHDRSTVVITARDTSSSPMPQTTSPKPSARGTRCQVRRANS